LHYTSKKFKIDIQYAKELPLFWLCCCFVPHPLSPKNAIEQYYHHRTSDFVDNGLSPETSGQSGTGANIDVKYHKIYWRINPDTAVKYIKGFIQTNFQTIQAKC
jgi:hypothetical protein